MKEQTIFEKLNSVIKEVNTVIDGRISKHEDLFDNIGIHFDPTQRNLELASVSLSDALSLWLNVHYTR
jgi:hypothetical protein